MLARPETIQGYADTPENLAKSGVEALLQDCTVLQIQVREVFRGSYGSSMVQYHLRATHEETGNLRNMPAQLLSS